MLSRLSPRWLLPLSLFVPLLAHAGPGLELEPGLTLLAPIVSEPLAVFPIVRQSTTPTGDFLTLKQGLTEKLVVVAELSAGGSVNQVRVTNNSDKNLLLLGGELILGGKQDRVLSADSIIEPHATRSVAVFCVEHGRWNGEQRFGTTGGFVEGKLRKTAKFDKEQGAVWSQVASKTSSLKAETSTGTYRALATGAQGKRAMERFAAVKQAFVALPEAATIVGLATAVNGTIRSVDVFANPALFANYRDALLDAAFVGAADVIVERSKAPPTAPAVKAFFDSANNAKDEPLERTSTGVINAKKGLGTLGTTVTPAAAKEPIYRSYQSDKE